MKPKASLMRLLKRNRDDQVFRIVKISPLEAVLVRIHDDRAHYSAPQQMELGELDSAIEEGVFTLLEDDPYWVEAPDLNEREEMSPEEWKREEEYDLRCDNAFEAVTWILNEADGTSIGDPDVWGVVTKAAATKFKKNVTTMRRWLNVCWKYAGSAYGLRAQFGTTHRGPMADSRKKNGRAGRPGMEGCKVTRAEREQIVKHIAECRGKNLTAKQSRDLYKDRYHRDGIDGYLPNGTPIVTHHVHTKVPSLPNFLRIWYDSKDYVADSIGNHGELKHKVNHRPKPGSYKAGTFSSLSRVEFDFTIGSKWLVALNDRKRVLGKSLMGAAYDMYSSLVAGATNSWERESEMNMRLLLENVMTDKVEFCARYGRVISPEQWPSCHVPELCVFDRGPGSKGKIGNEFPREFGTGWENVATGDPGQKPGVESLNAKLERLAKSRPGWEPRFWERSDEDDAKDACFNLDEDMLIFIEDILHHNNSESLGRYIDPDAFAAGCRTPSEVYIFGIQSKAGRARTVRQDTLRWRVAPPYRAVIAGNSLLFRGLEYYSDELIQMLTKAKALGRIAIIIRINPHRVNEIYYRPDPVARKDYIIPCRLTQRFRHYDGMSFAEVAAIQELDKLDQALRHPQQEKKDSERDLRVRTIAERAKKLTRSARIAGGLSPTDYLDDKTRLHRTGEAKARSEQDFSNAPTPTDSSPKNLIEGVVFGGNSSPARPATPLPASSPGKSKNKLKRFLKMRKQ